MIMGTFDIKLPIRQRPIFPRLCVACEKTEPNSTMDLSIIGANTSSVTEFAVDGLLDIGTGSAASNNVTVRIKAIPICPGCESRLKWYHRLLKFATYTIWLPALAFLLLVPGPLWIGIVVFIGIIIAPPILSMIFPPAFGATILNGMANFEFKSRLVADQFELLNETAKVNRNG